VAAVAETEKVEFEVKTTGVAKAAEEFDKLAKSQERVKATTDALNAAKAKSAELMRVNEYMAEAQALNASGAAAQATAQQFSVLSSAKAAANDNMGKLRGQVAATAGIIGQLGGAFTALVPAAGGFQTVLQRSLLSMGGFLGVLGGGPGVLLGGAVAAVAGLATVMSNASKEADALAKETEKNAKAMGSYLDQIQKVRAETGGKLKQQSAENQYQQDYKSGKLGVDDYNTAIEVTRASLEKLGGAQAIKAAYDANEADEMHRLIDLNEKLNKKMAEALGLRAQAIEQAAAAETGAATGKEFEYELDIAGGTPAEKKKAGKGTSWDPAKAEAENQERIDKLQALESEYEVKKIAREFEAIDRRREQGEIELEEYKARKEEELRFTQEGRDEEQAGFEKQMADMAAKRQQTNAAMLQGASIFAKSTVSVLQSAIKGHKMNAAAMVESIGDQLAASGTAHLLQAAAMAFIPGLQGNAGGLAAVGAIELAVGLGMGGVGAAAGGGGSGAGAGGGGSSGSTPVRSGGSEQAEATPTVVYVNFTSLTGPTPEQGRQVAQALEASYRVYGEDGTSRA